MHVDSAVYVDGACVARGDEPDAALARARELSGTAWIGLTRPAEAELRTLAGALSLPELAVEGSLRRHERSKLERYDDVLFLVLQPARYDDERESVECHEVDVFVGADFIVTVLEDDGIDVTGMRESLEHQPEILAGGPYAILWALLEAVTRGYRAVLDGVETDIDQIEEQLFSEHPDVIHRIFALSREVIDLQHATAPLVDMLDRLQHIVIEKTGLKEAPAFREVDDRARYISAKVDAMRHTLDNALIVHSSIVDQRRNEQMRRMTEFSLQQNDQVKKVSSWAAILFAPTLVGTIYGMNFRHMPELEWLWGYPMALGLMLATSVTLYVVFKRRDWL